MMTKANVYLVILLLTIQVSSSFMLLDRYNQFENYQREYGKNYPSFAIKLYRFKVYLENLREIEYLNKVEQGTAVYGETKFTDMSKAEMKSMLGLKMPPNFKLNYAANYTNQEEYKPKQSTPDAWNWEQQGAVTQVKDQGSCGSCWSFSTTGNIEGAYFLKYKKLIDFSEQQMIDCDKSNFGCGGGWPYQAIDWLSKNGGLQNLTSYPFRSNYSGPCMFNQSLAQAQVQGYMNISNNATVIKDALYELGPLSVGLDFTGLFHYKSGVANPRFCYTWPDHAVLLVGYGKSNGEDYWLIKNSWGPKWGINGYFMLKKGINRCGIEQWVTRAIMKE